MTKSQKLDVLQQSLRDIEQQLSPPSDAALAVLTSVLSSRQSIAIAQAANLLREQGVASLHALLSKAFYRLLKNGAKTDPGCIAKRAIANALYHQESGNTELFLAGIRHIQPEPVWGGTEDTAPGLRGICALGLVRAHYRHLMVALADLLADPEVEARIGAARAIAYSENPEGIALLRLKIHLGDPEPQVLSECCIAILKLAPESSFELVAQFLASPEPAVVELTALALGEARCMAAFPLIQATWRRTRTLELRQSLLLAIAMLRSEAAIEFLVGLVERSNLQDAQDALRALDIYRARPDIWQRVKAAHQLRGDTNLKL
ncbi:MAG: hypothetical protein AAFU71_07565 [Cyanobacteria bacterium J06632_22]